jgi:hypothetical protein
MHACAVHEAVSEVLVSDSVVSMVVAAAVVGPIICCGFALAQLHRYIAYSPFNHIQEAPGHLAPQKAGFETNNTPDGYRTVGAKWQTWLS